MADYDFSTLGSSDLENLVCDLLNADITIDSNVKYKTFKDGKDKGIDILYSSEANQYDHVGQVKHYYRTGFDGLLSHIKNTEVAKVKKLKPNQYILATSVDLSVYQSEMIRDAFSPFLKNLNDIYGKKDLNRLLQQYEAVQMTHFKLWFSDTSVLQKILNSKLIYRTNDFVKNELTRRFRLYVKTPILDSANKSLAENNFVVITGEPGVGKSTVAEMLVYEYLKNDYELLYIYDDIKEIENFLRDDNSKQIIYFDDFLGSNSIEINKAQGSETALLYIIRRIRKLQNKRLIFTTRIHILNTVIDQSEKLARANIRSGETVFNLHEYDTDIKKQLLINHIEEAEICDALKEVLQGKQIFDFIINHQSFNPRSIEYITRKENVERFSPDQYYQFITDNFNDPQEIWQHAYRFQIGIAERLLLNTLLTFDGPVKLPLLEKAFCNRVDMDEKAKLELEINAYKTALIRLDRGFIIIKNGNVDFFNASLKDFLKNFLKKDPHEIGLMLNSIKFVQQLSEPLLSMAKAYHIGPSDKLGMDIMLNFETYLRNSYRDHDLIRLATFVQKSVNHPQKDEYLVDILYAVNDWQSLYKDYSLNIAFSQFLESTKRSAQIQQALKDRTTEIVNDLFLGENDVFKAVKMLEQLKITFNLDFNNYDIREISNRLDELFSEHILNEVDLLKDFMLDEGEADEKISEVKDLQKKIFALGLNYKVDMSDFDEDWVDIAMENNFRRMMEKDD